MHAHFWVFAALPNNFIVHFENVHQEGKMSMTRENLPTAKLVNYNLMNKSFCWKNIFENHIKDKKVNHENIYL